MYIFVEGAMRSVYSWLVCLFLLCTVSWATPPALPPAPRADYCPVVIVNSTTLDPSQIYFVAHGQDPGGIPCFFVPDENGVCHYSYPTPSGFPSSAGESVKLSQLPTATGTSQTNPAFLVYLPLSISATLYFSIYHPVYLKTSSVSTGVIGISDTSVTTLTDPNYYTLHQPVEWLLQQPTVTSCSAAATFDLTGVDFFCLPILLSSYSYPSNTPLDPGAAPVSGMTASTPRSTFLVAIMSGLTSGQPPAPATATWGNLGQPYYSNPYTDTVPYSYIRTLAAKDSIANASGVTFKLSQVPQQFFPSDYFQNTAFGPTGATSYMQNLYDYYGSHNLYFFIYPAGEAGATYCMSSVPGQPDLLNFVPTAPLNGEPTVQLQLDNLLTEDLLSGGGNWLFVPGTGAYTTEMSKLLSALFSIGLLPGATSSISSPFVNNQGYFANLTYFTTPIQYNNAPWYNLYDKVLHKQFVSAGTHGPNPDLGLGYAYDFDDLLNLSGIINDYPVQDWVANPVGSQPYFVLTLGNLADGPGDPIHSLVPNINNDGYAYQVTTTPAANGVGVSFEYYNGSTTVITPASSTANVNLGTVHAGPTAPFQIHFTFGSQVYTYNINLQRQVVVPASTTASYSAIDTAFQESVVFTVTGTPPQFTVYFNSSPPPWPGG